MAVLKYKDGNEWKVASKNVAYEKDSSLFKGLVDRSITEVKAEDLDGVTYIRDNLFQSCSKLNSVSLPNSITSIGRYAFSQCGSLTTISLSDNLTDIYNYSFEYCSNLSSISLPNKVIRILGNAFANSGITSISLPNSLTSIGENAFTSCKKLTSIDIGNGLTSLPDRLFNWCSSLTTLVIPENITSLGEGVCRNCSKLDSITMKYNGVVNWKSSSGPFLYNDNLKHIYVPAEYLSAYKNDSKWSSYGDIFASYN